MNYTSLKLSKLLYENGFKKNSKYLRIGDLEYLVAKEQSEKEEFASEYEKIPAYDILNDLCVKCAKEIFGEIGYYTGSKLNKFTGIITIEEASNKVNDFEKGLSFKSYEETAIKILSLLQQNKQDEAEEYLWANCKFNPNNK